MILIPFEEAGPIVWATLQMMVQSQIDRDVTPSGADVLEFWSKHDIEHESEIAQQAFAHMIWYAYTSYYSMSPQSVMSAVDWVYRTSGYKVYPEFTPAVLTRLSYIIKKSKEK